MRGKKHGQISILMQDSTTSILQSAKRFFTGTAFSRISGLGRDVAMAFAFGTQETVAAFFVAFRFSHLLRRLLGEGALQTAFIPQFENLKRDTPQRAALFFRDMYASLLILLAGIVILSMLGIAGCLHFGNLSSGNQEILNYTLWLMPGLLFICLFGLNASLLQCEKHFFTPSVAPVIFNLVWILGVFLIHTSTGTAAMTGLSFFVVLACAGQWLVTVPATVSILKAYGTPGLKAASPFSLDVRRMAKPLLLGTVGVAASQVNNALDAVFARYADSQAPAFLWYAIRIQQLPLALFGIALSGALLPPLTRALKDLDVTKYRIFLRFALQRGSALMIPLACAIFVLGHTSVQVIYGRGDFSAASVDGTSLCLWGYGLGLVPMTLILILAPAFYAQEDYRIPARASLYAMLLNVALNTWFVMGLNLGGVSIAVATSLAAWFNCVYLALSLKRKNGVFLSGTFWFSIAKVSLASGLASFCVMVADPFIPAQPVLKLLLLSLLFFTSLALSARILQAEDLTDLFKREAPVKAK